MVSLAARMDCPEAFRAARLTRCDRDSGPLPELLRFMLLRSLAVVGAVFAMLNLGLSLTMRAAALWDRPADVQTRNMLHSRVRQAFSAPRAPEAVFIGDSLVLGAHLSERDTRWEQRTLSAQFARLASDQTGRPYGALNLGINGVLYSELACVSEVVLAHQPAVVVIHVSPRPFSDDFRVATTETERAFLCPPQHSMPRIQGTVDGLRNAVPVLRDRDLLQFLMLGAPPRAALLAHMHDWLAPPAPPMEEPSEDDLEAAEILKEMAWRTKAAARLASVRVDSQHPQAPALTRLLALLSNARSTRVMLFYLTENLEPLAAQMDVNRYGMETRRFEQLVRRQLSGTHVSFDVVPQSSLAGHYTDHVHLDADGYRILAQRLLATVHGKKP